MSEARLLVTALLFLAGGYFLERSGVFLYSTDGVVRAAGIPVAVGFALWGFLISRGLRMRPMLLGVATGYALAGLAWQLQGMRTSSRKAFYVEALMVKEGMSFRDAQLVMAPYRPYSVGPGHTSFSFRSAAQTEDVLVVEYDPTTQRIIKAELSLD